jgi:hypothetical protein
MGLFSTKVKFLTYENNKKQGGLTSHSDSISQGYMVLDSPAFHMDSFLRRHRDLLSFTSKGLFCRRCGSSQFKIRIERPYSFYNTTQFSLLNNVPDALAFNLHSSLTRDTVFRAFT